MANRKYRKEKAYVVLRRFLCRISGVIMVSHLETATSFAHATEQGGPIPDAGFWVSIQLPVPIGVLSCALGLYAYAKSFEGAKRRLLNALAITALSIGVVWFLVAATITILAFSS